MATGVTIAAGAVGAGVGLVFLKRWLSGGRCHSNARMDGKTVIITGCNTGIGKESAKDLAKRGARVIMACRNIEKAEEARLDVVRESGSSNVLVKKLDLASMKSIREFAEDIKREEKQLNVLLNNAGVMLCPQWETEDGFEMQFGTNHLGHFLLTLLLLDLIKASAPSRIVNVSSNAHRRGNMNLDDVMMSKKYEALQAYGQSKLANVMFTRELARRLKGTGVTSYSLHPGVINTDLGRHFGTYASWAKPLLFFTSPFLKTSEQGAQTSIYCCVDEKAGQETGLYYMDCAATEPIEKAKDDEVAKKLWDLSLKLVELEE
ncbi:retinol dehydrogenase 13 [Strongylocentrotus purpuratus]|uniref:Retinol dehydrogenase 13 n=1 Tax=Strongylocentrotus purpuratus TaxID=7668 RepID=A0A7M7RG71_STRPU|nr:retinol dehydrogenase 13 [Strongylocentrotus purpuratus]|eukprot:XP_788671.3 PREDICTED: retinol dehydrogenase 13 isoform X1 [Strongylocentrotus purpuratus]